MIESILSRIFGQKYMKKNRINLNSHTKI